MASYFIRIHAKINHVLRQIKQILFSVFCASSKGTAETKATETPSDEIFLAPVKIDGKWGYINKAGKIVIKPQFEDARWFQEGLARIKLGGRWGYID
ncbi:MAG: hypothetical protein CRN43_18915, partial [Candidatus Nephrothrix sp. EaCA]